MQTPAQNRYYEPDNRDWRPRQSSGEERSWVNDRETKLHESNQDHFPSRAQAPSSQAVIIYCC